MRVTFETIQRHTSLSINTAAKKLFELQRQVATGKRVQRPSDDPAAAATATVERARLAATDQYSAASNSSASRLAVADTVLSDIVQQLTSAQVTVLSARASNLTVAQREARALELETLRDAVLQDLNTSFRSSYLFSGASGTRPYAKNGAGVVSAYQGSTVEVELDIDNGLDATVAFNGLGIAQGTAPDDVFVVMDRAIAAARSGDNQALNTVAGELEAAFNRATFFQSRVGAAQRAIDDGLLRLSEAARRGEAQLSALEDTNMAAAVTGMAQAETVYRAALGAAAQIQNLSLMDYLR